jgi:hypothetical protein
MEMNGQSQGPDTSALSSPVTGEYYISRLRRFLVTVLLVFQTYSLLSVREKIGKQCIYVIRKKDGEVFSAVQLLRLVHTDTQLNRCCLLFQLRNGIDTVPEVLYKCLFKRWMN